MGVEASQKRPWELAFGLGILFTSVALGCTLGGLLGGIHLDNERFAGGMLDWATPFGVCITLGVILGFVMLRANFLVLKMEGHLQQLGFRYPQMVPNVIGEAVTVANAAAASQTLMFMLIVVVVLLPIILIYTSYEFWVFCGKMSNY